MIVDVIRLLHNNRSVLRMWKMRRSRRRVLQSGNVSKFRFICSFCFNIYSGYTFGFLHGLIRGSQFCRRKEVSWKQSIISYHLSALRSPIRPFILPPHAEQVAQVFANASSLEPADESSGIPLEVERYLM